MNNRLLRFPLGVFIGLLSCLVSSYAQDPTFAWSTVSGDTTYYDAIARGVAVDKQGNVYNCGSFNGEVDFNSIKEYVPALGFNDGYIMKTDKSGHFLWSQQIGGTNAFVNAYSLTLDDSGNIYVVGSFSGTVHFGNGGSGGSISLTSQANTDDIFVAKYNETGTCVWAMEMGGAGGSDAAYALTYDNGGYIYITGDFTGNASFGTVNLTGKGTQDVFIMKMDTNGKAVWAKSVGGKRSVNGYAIAVDIEKNVYVKGAYRGDTVDFDPGAGSSYMSTATNAIFLLKLTDNGDYVWAKQMEGAQKLQVGKSLAIDACGDLYMTASFTGTVDFDPDTSTFYLTKASNKGDAFVVKWNSYGKFIWAKNLGGISTDMHGAAIDVDQSGRVYTTGFFNDIAVMDSASNTYLFSNGGNDIYLSVHDQDGSYLWAGQIGGAGYDYPSALLLDDYNNMYISGYFEGTVDFDPTSGGTAIKTAAGLTYSLFVSKLSYVDTASGGTISLQISGPDSVCSYQHYTFTTDQFPGATYSWNLPNGWTGSSTTDSISVMTGEEGGEIIVSVYRKCDTLTVNYVVELLLLPVHITVNGDVLSTTNKENYDTWQWYLDGEPIEGANADTYAVHDNGLYSVVVTGKGCSDTATYLVNNTGIAHNTAKDYINIYPNPVRNTLHIAVMEPAVVYIRQLDGKMVTTKTLHAGINTCDLNTLHTGMYLLSIMTREGMLIKTEKLVKAD